jgi:hypothetical protein
MFIAGYYLFNIAVFYCSINQTIPKACTICAVYFQCFSQYFFVLYLSTWRIKYCFNDFFDCLSLYLIYCFIYFMKTLKNIYRFSYSLLRYKKSSFTCISVNNSSLAFSPLIMRFLSRAETAQ